MKIIIISIFILLLLNLGFAQTIPADSLYLGQTPPSDSPKIFSLSVTPGFFASERLTISNDGKNIYYGEINGYTFSSTSRLKYYSYVNNKWTGPINLFEGFCAPALSFTEDTMYLENSLSVKKDNGWSNPKRFLLSAHYFQAANKNHYYILSKPDKGNDGKDYCMIFINGIDTIILGAPLNPKKGNYDFFISKDESFMILAWSSSALSISYHKSDGSWTNPKSLGNKINNQDAKYLWGPFVTNDNRYLFFSKFPSLPNNRICWVRIDDLIDSLKHTNFVPYLKNQIKDQTGSPGHLFSFSVPDSIFIDDDGNNTLTYTATITAKLDNEITCPSWLHFNTDNKTFSGIPAGTGKYIINVTAIDWKIRTN